MDGPVASEIEHWKAYYRRQRARLSRPEALMILGAILVPWLREGRDASELSLALAETGITATSALELVAVIRSFVSNPPDERLIDGLSATEILGDRRATEPDPAAWVVRQCHAAGKPLRKIGRSTYVTPSGRTAHLRTSKRHTRGRGEASYWFGLAEEVWGDGDLFVFACAHDFALIVPSSSWRPYREAIPIDGQGRRQATLWRTDAGGIELRVGGLRVDVRDSRDRFDLL
jgi:hypothetical protein